MFWRSLYIAFLFLESASELRAYIHQIKLYFHFILAHEFAAVGILTPAKLDDECVRLSFDEMRQEGFADDGLFDQMKLFFLPLTMIEEDLSIDESQLLSISRLQSPDRGRLLAEQEKLHRELVENVDQYYRHDDSITKFNREMNFQRQLSSGSHRVEGHGRSSVRELLDVHENAMKQLVIDRHDLQARIEAIKILLDRIDQGWKERYIHDNKGLDRDLIKPNRGFIMYGPP
ncbi:unnamed protein product, partial [Didymodactylos carnosus]